MSVTLTQPGLFTAGSIQVRASDGILVSDSTPMGPMIIPYPINNVRWVVINTLDGYKGVIIGVAIPGITIIDYNVPDPNDMELGRTIADEYGHFVLIIEDEINLGSFINHYLFSFDGSQYSLGYPSINFDFNLLTYTLNGQQVNITTSPGSNEYSFDGGLTWTPPSDIPNGIYSESTIQARISHAITPWNAANVGKSTINPYLPRDIRLVRDGSNWLVSGTGDIGANVEVLTIGGSTVNSYGDFEIEVPIMQLGPGESQTLSMSKGSLSGSITLNFPTTSPPPVTLTPDGMGSLELIVGAAFGGIRYQYSINGGMTWSIPTSAVNPGIIPDVPYPHDVLQVRYITNGTGILNYPGDITYITYTP